MTRAPRFDLCGCGSLVVDRIRSVPQIAGGDQKVHLAGAPDLGLLERAGGVTLNHLGWARLFGLRVAVVGKQADDPEGRFLRGWMQRLGIEPFLDLTGSASSRAEIYVDSRGQRAVYMFPGATSELTGAEIDRQFAGVIGDSRFVSSEISQLPLEAVERIFARARESGARTVLDLDVPPGAAIPALGSEAQLHAALGASHVVKASLSAAREWTASASAADAAQRLAERYGCEAVVITQGEEGAWVRARGEAFSVGAAEVGTVRDTTGAGDAFLGGLLAALCSGTEWPEAVRLGNACAAACCERFGAFPEEPQSCRKRALEHYQELGGATVVFPELTLHEPSVAPADAYLACALEELGHAAEALDRDVLRALAEWIRRAEARGGRLHLTGIGKSAHVARYTAALLASTGTPALYLDASEATHGSVGQLVAGDALIALSNSGTTAELLASVHAACGLGARVAALTARPDSPLAQLAELHWTVRVRQEGGPLGLPPRTSVLAQTLALTALSAELQASRDFGVAEYGQRHPGGELGRRARGSAPEGTGAPPGRPALPGRPERGSGGA